MGRKGKPVLYEIYILKGIAILGLIVLHTYLPLINPSIHKLILNSIGPYAMPMFMFASGFLFGFSRLEIFSLADYSAFIRKKFNRLMIPYFAVWAIYITTEFGIETASMFTSLNYHVDRDFWKYILFYPSRGTALHLWFLYHLFFVFLAFPVLRKFLRNHLVLFLSISALYLVPVPKFSYFNHGAFREVLMFFCVGYLYSLWRFEDINRYSKYLCIVSLGLLIVLSAQRMAIVEALSILLSPYTVRKLLKLVIISSGVFFYYYLSVSIKNHKIIFLSNLLGYLGVYSAPIYLFHHISIVAARGLFINVLNINRNLSPFASILIFLSGIILPVLFTKHIIKRFKILPPLLLGVREAPSFKPFN
jgi:fucose 4-O-acetylase-like acetyltransferase